MSQVPTIEPIQVLADILELEMAIPNGQIMLGFENWEIPKNKGLYVALFYGPDTVVGSNNTFDPVVNEEVQSVAMLHEIIIEVLSFDESARLRKEEVIMALSSVRAQQTLEANLMKISELPTSFIPVPDLEETKQLNRYRIGFHMNALHQKTKSVPYYDDFGTPAVTTNQ